MADVEGVIAEINVADECLRQAKEQTDAMRNEAEKIAIVTMNHPSVVAVSEAIAQLFSSMRSSAKEIEASGAAATADDARTGYKGALGESHTVTTSATLALSTVETAIECGVQTLETLDQGEQQLLGMLRFVVDAVVTQGHNTQNIADDAVHDINSTEADSAEAVQRLRGGQ